MYKKFIFIVFLLPIILFSIYSYIVINDKMFYENQEYPMWLEVKNRIHTKSTYNAELIVLGDSRAKADFIPNQLTNIRSINLSVGGGTPIEGYFTLEAYLKNNKAPKKIIFSYTPTNLCGDNCYWDRTIAFNFLTDNQLEEIQKEASKLDEKSIIKNNKKFTDYMYPVDYGSSFKNGIIGMRWFRNKIVLKECQTSRGHHFFGTEEYANGLNSEAKANVFSKSRLQDSYFNKLLNLAKSKNIKLYFYIMPFNKSSFDKVKIKYVNGYEKYIKNLSLKYGMKLCNKVFYMENSDFGDPSHLFKGAKMNTAMMLNCIN